MLSGKWDTDNGNEQYGCEYKMYNCSVKPSKNQPDYIAKNRKTAHAAAGRNDPFTKRPNYQSGNFETLHPPGNTYNGKAKHKPTKYITHCCQKASENEPNDVADEIHAVKLMKFQVFCFRLSVLNFKFAP